MKSRFHQLIHDLILHGPILEDPDTNPFSTKHKDLSRRGLRHQPKKRITCDNRDAPMTRDSISTSLFERDDLRSRLESDYLDLVRRRLPERASAEGWPIRFDHCFMRIALDHAFGGCWYDFVDRSRGPAYRSISDEALGRAIAVAQSLLREDRQYLEAMNRQSLAWRGKA